MAFCFIYHPHLSLLPILMLTRLVARLFVDLPRVIVFFLATTYCHGLPSSRLSRSSVEAEYRGVANVVVETAWVCNLLSELHAPLLIATLVIVIMLVSFICPLTRFNINVLSILRSIYILFVILWLLDKSVFFMFLRGFSILIFLTRAFQVLYFSSFTPV